MFEDQQATQPTKRDLYSRFIPEEKAEVGKRAALPAEHETVLGLHIKSIYSWHVYCRNLVWEQAVWGVRTNGRG